MNAKMWSAAVLGALVAAGLAGSADAATKRMKNQQVRVTGYPAGQFYIAPGDSVASIRQARSIRTRQASASSTICAGA